MQHAGRVLSRDQLLTEVWGYRYTGGTRTVDVHVRRLREKLPPLVDALVTVKQFGYKLVDGPTSTHERSTLDARRSTHSDPDAPRIPEQDLPRDLRSGRCRAPLAATMVSLWLQPPDRARIEQSLPRGEARLVADILRRQPADLSTGGTGCRG